MTDRVDHLEAQLRRQRWVTAALALALAASWWGGQPPAQTPWIARAQANGVVQADGALWTTNQTGDKLYRYDVLNGNEYVVTQVNVSSADWPGPPEVTKWEPKGR